MTYKVSINILIVEDEESVASFVRQACHDSGYVPTHTDNGLEGLRLAQSVEFDLILLDAMLPGMHGFELCKRIRQARIPARVLLVTALDGTEDKVAGLDAGADDYIVKPFKMVELLARMRALLRRGTPSHDVLRVGDLALDTASRLASRGGKTIHLSVTEYTLLEYLMRHPNRVLSRATILDHVWSYDFSGVDNVLDVYIMYLRNKIDKGQEYKLIHTVRGVGFRLGRAG